MPHTTVTFFRFDSFSTRWWMFKQMGLAFGKLAQSKGLVFGRLFGSGAGNGFSLWPNFGLYGWLGQWETEDDAVAFEQSDWFVKAKQKAAGITVFHLSPTMAHGEWEGKQPFPLDGNYDPQKPVAVITRATIRTRKLLDFWRYVPQTSKSVFEHPDRKLSVGIGEYPIFMQATFSYWTSGQAMSDFAYKSKYHKEVVKLTRERNWYKEELFARFTVLRVENIAAGAISLTIN